MKTIVPKHVESGLFDMAIEIGPFRVKMWQLFLIAVGVAIMFGISNGLMKSGLGTIPAIIISSPALIIMLFIAFFRKSELYIIAFCLKLIRTYIIGTPKTFQKNIIKPSDLEIQMNLSKLNSGDEKEIKQKELNKKDLGEGIEILSKW